MALPANSSKGTYLYYSADNSNWTRIPNCTSVQSPQTTVGENDDTTLDSTGYYKEKTPGYIDPGKASFKARFSDSVYSALRAYFDSQTVLYWKMTYPLRGTQTTKAQKTWTGFLTKWDDNEKTADDNNKLEMDGELCVTGQVTFTAGS